MVSHPVVLVEPGDGSWGGLRTPILTWEVEGPSGPIPTDRPPGCGNLNPLTTREVFELKPGETRLLDSTWVPWVYVKEPGSYGFTLYYENDPARKWRSEMQNHDEAAMKKVRSSTPVRAMSNTGIVLVK